MRRVSLASVVAAAALIAVPSGASAATTTIGQLAPAPTLGCANPDPYDALQATVTSGNSYVVPVNGTITSWSNNTAVGAGQQLTFKIFRKGAGANEYQAVVHDGPRTLTSGALSTFPVSFPVQAGDLIGINDGTNFTSCTFDVGGETGYLEHLGDLADGASGIFNSRPAVRLNLTAVLTTEDPLKCKGKPVTVLGTPGNDTQVGTPGADVMLGLGGKDKLNGAAGKDLICGGTGKDTLTGGKGKDSLFGQAGRDKLRGGGARDVCAGGKGSDSASKCEAERSL